MRFFLALYLANLTKLFFVLFKFGAGGTWPGHIALKIYPNILADPRIHFKKGLVFVTGTNGKTTTTKIITHLLSKQGQSVVHNTTGANLINGVVSEILTSFNWSGNFDYDYGVFEIDEFSLPKVLKFIHPSAVCLLNLSRDQLDRYGETDIIFDRWLEVFALHPEIPLIYDAQTEAFGRLKSLPNPTCPFDDSTVFSDKTKLKGTFNVKNLNVAIQVMKLLRYSPEVLLDHLEDFDFAFGRGEQLDKFFIYLAKNPASFDNNLKLLDDFEPTETGILMILNDNIPDGRDVSWIYDINTNLLNTNLRKFKHIFVAGTRAYDLAVRLSYAGIPIKEDRIYRKLDNALAELQGNTPLKNIVVFPNYSAMLQIREKLTGRAIL